MPKIDFPKWWVMNVGRPPTAGESELYRATRELFDYATELEEDLEECKSSLTEALELGEKE